MSDKKEEKKEVDEFIKEGRIELKAMYKIGFNFYKSYENNKNELIGESIKNIKNILKLIKNERDFIKNIKNKKKIEEAKQEIDLQKLVMKKYKSPLKIWEIYTASNVYTNIAYYYILNKHNNDCIIIAPDKSLRGNTIKLVAKINDKKNTVELKFPLLKQNGNTIKDYFESVKECKSNFVALPLLLNIKGTKSNGHANMIIINKELKKAYRFEPHGEQTRIGKSYSELFEKMDAKLEEIFTDNNYIYERSSSFCPRKGFQSLEASLKDEIGEYGYCQMWSAFFLDLVLTYPKLNMKELVDKSFLVLEKNPQKFKQFIRDYASGFVGILEELVDKLATTEKMRKKITEFFTDKKIIDNDKNPIWDKVIDLINDMTIEQASKIKKDNTILIDKMKGSGVSFSRMGQARRLQYLQDKLNVIDYFINSKFIDYIGRYGISQDEYLKYIKEETNYNKQFGDLDVPDEWKPIIEAALNNIYENAYNLFIEHKNEPKQVEKEQKRKSKLQEELQKRDLKEEQRKEKIYNILEQKGLPKEIIEEIYRSSMGQQSNIDMNILERQLQEDRRLREAQERKEEERIEYDDEEDIGSGKKSTGDYQLHTVIVKKPVELKRAKEISEHFIDHKPTYRQTKTSYRFKNIDKSEFKEKSFKTKKVNPQISLVYGILKNPQQFQGAGLKDLWNGIKDKVRQFRQNPIGAILSSEYCGPFTDLSTDRKPVNRTDAVCKKHDISYHNIGEAKKRGVSREERIQMTRKADDDMIKELETFKEEGLKNKALHFLSKNGIKLKRYLEDKNILDPLKFSGGLYYAE